MADQQVGQGAGLVLDREQCGAAVRARQPCLARRVGRADQHPLPAQALRIDPVGEQGRGLQGLRFGRRGDRPGVREPAVATAVGVGIGARQGQRQRWPGDAVVGHGQRVMQADPSIAIEG